MMLRLLAVLLGAAARLRPEPHRAQLAELGRELAELSRQGPQPRSSA